MVNRETLIQNLITLNNKNVIKMIYGLIIVLFIYSTNWEVDPLHDGLTFPSALAISQGKIIFRDVHTQYGLLQPTIEGFFIYLTGPYLIIQRLVATMCIIFTSIIIYLCCKNLSNFNPYIPAITFLALTPSWNNMPSTEHPIARAAWPNSYGVLFQMIFIYLFILYQKKLKANLLFLCGIALAVSAFARIQFALISVIILISTLIIGRSRKYIILVIGYILTISVFLITLFKEAALSFLFDQIIRVLFDSGYNSVRAPSFGTSIKIYFALGIILLSFFIIMLLINNRTILFLLIYSSIILMTYFLYPNSTQYSGKLFSLIKIISENVILSPIFFIIIISNLLIIFQIIYTLKNKTRFIDLIMNNKVYTLICVVSLTNMIQMHIFSSGYYYFILPSYLILFYVFYLKFIKENINFMGSKLDNLNSIAFPLIICLSITNYFFTVHKKSYLYDAPVLKYMKSYDPNKFPIVNNITLTEANFPLGSTVSINCLYGLYSVNQNGYISNSRYQWNYLPTELMKDKIKIDSNLPPNYLINCSNTDGTRNTLIFANHNYKEIKRFKINNNEILTINELSR